MQAWGGARNASAAEVSLPGDGEQFPGNPEITAGRDRADAFYIRALRDENPES